MSQQETRVRMGSIVCRCITPRFLAAVARAARLIHVRYGFRAGAGVIAGDLGLASTVSAIRSTMGRSHVSSA